LLGAHFLERSGSTVKSEVFLRLSGRVFSPHNKPYGIFGEDYVLHIRKDIFVVELGGWNKRR
jgi:hypothetical protein